MASNAALERRPVVEQQKTPEASVSESQSLEEVEAARAILSKMSEKFGMDVDELEKMATDDASGEPTVPSPKEKIKLRTKQTEGEIDAVVGVEAEQDVLPESGERHVAEASPAAVALELLSRPVTIKKPEAVAVGKTIFIGDGSTQSKIEQPTSEQKSPAAIALELLKRPVTIKKPEAVMVQPMMDQAVDLADAESDLEAMHHETMVEATSESVSAEAAPVAIEDLKQRQEDIKRLAATADRETLKKLMSENNQLSRQIQIQESLGAAPAKQEYVPIQPTQMLSIGEDRVMPRPMTEQDLTAVQARKMINIGGEQGVAITADGVQGIRVEQPTTVESVPAVPDLDFERAVSVKENQVPSLDWDRAEGSKETERKWREANALERGGRQPIGEDHDEAPEIEVLEGELTPEEVAAADQEAAASARKTERVPIGQDTEVLPDSDVELNDADLMENEEVASAEKEKAENDNDRELSEMEQQKSALERMSASADALFKAGNVEGLRNLLSSNEQTLRNMAAQVEQTKKEGGPMTKREVIMREFRDQMLDKTLEIGKMRGERMQKQIEILDLKAEAKTLDAEPSTPENDAKKKKIANQVKLKEAEISGLDARIGAAAADIVALDRNYQINKDPEEDEKQKSTKQDGELRVINIEATAKRIGEKVVDKLVGIVDKWMTFTLTGQSSVLDDLNRWFDKMDQNYEKERQEKEREDQQLLQKSFQKEKSDEREDTLLKQREEQLRKREQEDAEFAAKQKALEDAKAKKAEEAAKKKKEEEDEEVEEDAAANHKEAA